MKVNPPIDSWNEPLLPPVQCIACGIFYDPHYAHRCSAKQSFEKIIRTNDKKTKTEERHG